MTILYICSLIMKVKSFLTSHTSPQLLALKYFSGTVLRYKEKLTSTDPGQIDLALVAQMLKHLPTMQEAQV